MCVTISTCHAAGTPKFPAVLIFGDSTVDSGNNNYVSTVFRSNHSPYGADFVNNVATGRFSDGRLVPDFLVSELGIKQLLPPFLDPTLTDDEIRTGVCFASAGSGFDKLTTSVSGVITVSQQIGMFQNYTDRLKGIAGEGEATRIINNALILISAGTNDFVFNFYDLPTRRTQYNISEYQDFLLQKLQDLLKGIYDLGGRKIAVAGLAPIGCIPLQITAKFNNPKNRACINEQNSDAMVYNSKLEKMLTGLQESFHGSRIVYGNLYDPVMDMINNPQKYGFEETLKGCCGTGFIESGPLCNKLTSTCKDSSKFLFWDAIHPTEAAYHPVAEYILETVVPKLY